MLKILITAIFAVAILPAIGQSNWGYCFAKVSSPVSSSGGKDYMFVSGLVKLKRIDCDSISIGLKAILASGNTYKVLDECASSRFYERVRERHPEQAAALEKDQIIPITHFFSDEDMRKYIAGEDRLLSKREARLRRDALLNVVKANNKSVLVVVD